MHMREIFCFRKYCAFSPGFVAGCIAGDPTDSDDGECQALRSASAGDGGAFTEDSTQATDASMGEERGDAETAQFNSPVNEKLT